MELKKIIEEMVAAFEELDGQIVFDENGKCQMTFEQLSQIQDTLHSFFRRAIDCFDEFDLDFDLQFKINKAINNFEFELYSFMSDAWFDHYTSKEIEGGLNGCIERFANKFAETGIKIA